MTDPFALLFVKRLERMVRIRQKRREFGCCDWREPLLDRGIYSTVSDLRAMGLSEQAERAMEGHS